jgi:acyl-coenzyme A synthetase/AMP-(fatty) acid ligase
VRALQEHMKRTLAPYKYPRAVEFSTALPKTPTGKLMRSTLRNLANENVRGRQVLSSGLATQERTAVIVQK